VLYRYVEPGSFDPHKHWYEKAFNAQLHPLVRYFLNLTSAQIVARYCHLCPAVSPQRLLEVLRYEPRYFAWAGADLLHVTSEQGRRRMVVLETNSCPSGQKSMPLLNEAQELGGYGRLLEQTFLRRMRLRKKLPEGDVAVLWDKNEMENSGYAAAMAELLKEPVHLVYCDQVDWRDILRIKDRVLYVRTDKGTWRPLRAAFRYVTQRPWNRLPINLKTFLFNPVITCLSGGRNKMLAAKSYDLFNVELAPTGLRIDTPTTIWDVRKEEVPLWVSSFGGHAVVKVPYSNAGQGVYTIVNQQELQSFMEEKHHYECFIVQSLIGHSRWGSVVQKTRYYHVGTVPNKQGLPYAADIRMVIHSTEQGFRPLTLYSRRAKLPLSESLQGGCNSWDMLGTNLSAKAETGEWTTDTSRLLLMDNRDFNRLGIGLDDLIEAFIQTVLATIAIDKMACRLIGEKGILKLRLFRSLDEDNVLIDEIWK
jgi:hypothetical protein